MDEVPSRRDHVGTMLSSAQIPDARDEFPNGKPQRKYAEGNRATGGTAPVLAGAIAVLGGEPIVARALEVLLTSAGYDARVVGDLGNGDPGQALDGARLLLLAPTVEAGMPGTLAYEIKALAILAKLPVLTLVTTTSEHPQQEDGAYYVPWPCRMAELAREIDAALLRLSASQVPPVSG